MFQHFMNTNKPWQEHVVHPQFSHHHQGPSCKINFLILMFNVSVQNKRNMKDNLLQVILEKQVYTFYE